MNQYEMRPPRALKSASMWSCMENFQGLLEPISWSQVAMEEMSPLSRDGSNKTMILFYFAARTWVTGR